MWSLLFYSLTTHLGNRAERQRASARGKIAFLTEQAMDLLLLIAEEILRLNNYLTLQLGGGHNQTNCKVWVPPLLCVIFISDKDKDNG